jgi:hypothetical protein
MRADAPVTRYTGAGRNRLTEPKRTSERERASMHRGAQALLGAAVLAATAFAGAAPPARADGAIAIGSTGDVVRDGIAFGQVVDEPKEAASETALQHCRSFKARAAAERCKVVVTFSRQCYAVAYDPEPGTPGAGWGVAPDDLEAMQKAVSMCEEAAGPARKGYCQVVRSGCDTTGQDTSQTVLEERPQADGKPTQGAAPVPPPVAPPAAPQRTAPAKSPAQGKDRGAGSGAPSPVFLAGAMATVGVGYTLGQLARGKAQGGLGQRQVLTGGMLVAAAGVAASLLGSAGLAPAIVMAIAGGMAVAAAILA